MQRFGFIVHPIDVGDIARKFPMAKRLLPDSWLESMMPLVPPMVVSHATGIESITGEQAEGWFVGLTLTPRLMVEKLPERKVVERIIAAGRKAQEQGARIVGLGAFTAVVADAGVTVAKNLDIAVTTGNTYTVATALEGIEYAARELEVTLADLPVCVLGASGSIGRACARVLAGRGLQVTLVARDRYRLEETAALIESENGVRPAVETDLGAAVREARVVVAVTSAMESVVDAEDLQPGTIVCDVSRPRNVSKVVALQRQDVLVFEGGVVKVPGNVDFGFDFGFPPGTSYACMAETMILALEGRYEGFSLGRNLDVARVSEIAVLAQKHGFLLSGLRSFERAVPPEVFARVKRVIHGGQRHVFT